MRISLDHPSLAGHFPGHPVVPGVVLLDSVLAALRERFAHKVGIATMPAVKFHAPVRPGGEFEVQFTERPGGETLNFEVRAEGILCVSGTLTPTVP